MKTDRLYFNNQEFPYAVIKIFGGTAQEEYVNVSTTQLESLLVDPTTQNYTSPKAQVLDEQIGFYLKADELAFLPVHQIVQIIESNW